MFNFLKRKTTDNEEFRKQEREKIWNNLQQFCYLETRPYNNLIIEPEAYRQQGTLEKELFTYDKSDERIKNNNPHARHPLPQEALGLIIDCLENKVNDEKLKKVKEDMFKSYGEWLSCAFERQGNQLIVYLDPTGISWNGSKYIKTDNFKFSDKKEFDITGINSTTWVDLSNFSNDFVKYLYERIFNELPAEMKEGSKRAQVYLPPDKTFWPVGRCYFVNVYYVVLAYFIIRGSGGVVVGKKILTTN